MDYRQSLAWLGARARGGADPELHRIRSLLGSLGHPELGLRGIHVVGTNGKGSTCAMAVAALARTGLRIGSMPSPHLQDYTERIRIDGLPIQPDVFAVAVTRVAEGVARLESAGLAPTHFEVMTCAALVHFKTVKVDAAVIEAGIGGGNDATNVLELGVKVLTNVGLDHCAQLGASTSSIARAKSGVFRRNDLVILGPLDPDAEREAQASITAAGDVAVCRLGSEIEIDCYGKEILVRNPFAVHAPLDPVLKGFHQQDNLSLAITAVDGFCRRNGFPPPRDDQWQQALDSLVWPGRLEVVDGVELGAWSGRFVLDGAHNGHAMAIVLDEVERLVDHPVTVIVAASGERPVAEILARIPGSWRIIVTTTSHRNSVPIRGMTCAVPAERARVDSAEDVGTALRLAVREEHSGTIVVLGSLMLVGAVRAILGLLAA